jgi:hypothetical protein
MGFSGQREPEVETEREAPLIDIFDHPTVRAQVEKRNAS